MPRCRCLRSFRVLALILVRFSKVSTVQAQGVKRTVSETGVADSDGDHVQERNEWFSRGWLVHGKSSAGRCGIAADGPSVRNTHLQWVD